MPAFLVELRRGGLSLLDGAASFLVFAFNEADARAAVRGRSANDAIDSAVNEATVTEVVAASSFSGYELVVTIPTLGTPIKVTSDGNVLGAASAVIAAGGTGYTANDILTVSGGSLVSGGHAARFRVTGETGGVIDTVELVDPGTYSALPSNPASTTGGTGTGGTLTITAAGLNVYNAFVAELVDLLNATAAIAGATMDVSAGTRLLTVASGSGGDDLGDETVLAEFRKNGAPLPGLLGAITHEGVATDPLTIALPAVGNLVAAQVLATFKR